MGEVRLKTKNSSLIYAKYGSKIKRSIMTITNDFILKYHCTTIFVHEFYMFQHTSNSILMINWSVVMQQVVVPQAKGHSALSSLI